MPLLPAFIFDLDGVITDTAYYHFLAWKKLADGLGISFTEDDNEQLKGVGRRESLQFILARSNKHFDDTEIETLMTRKNEDYQQLITKITAKDILPNADHVLRHLKGKGHKIGLASASKNARTVIERLGIAPAFDYVADAALIPNSKPAPDVFLDVMKAFGLTPRDCIGVEDAAAGVVAINAAHMFAVGIGDDEILSHADLVIPSMADFDYAKIMAAWKNSAKSNNF